MPALALPRPAPDEYPPVFHEEILLVPEADDFAALLAAGCEETCALAARFGEEGAALQYAPGKWTVREIIGHLADCERILSYRLLRFLRRDATVLPGFDHDAYVPAGDFERRPLADVAGDFAAVRAATRSLVSGAPATAFAFRGHVGRGTITANALIHLIAGHELHHQAMLRTRYLPLLAPRHAERPAHVPDESARP